MLLAISLGAVGLSPSAAGDQTGREAKHRVRHPLVTRAETRGIHVASGAAVKRFELSEPGGAIRLLRVTVPQGTRAQLTAVIPGTAGVGISVPRGRVDSAEVCRRAGAVDVCSQSEEACPMPPATWRFRLRKLAGPAGEIRIEFAVGH